MPFYPKEGLYSLNYTRLQDNPNKPGQIEFLPLQQLTVDEIGYTVKQRTDQINRFLDRAIDGLEESDFAYLKKVADVGRLVVTIRVLVDYDDLPDTLQRMKYAVVPHGRSYICRRLPKLFEVKSSIVASHYDDWLWVHRPGPPSPTMHFVCATHCGQSMGKAEYRLHCKRANE